MRKIIFLAFFMVLTCILAACKGASNLGDISQNDPAVLRNSPPQAAVLTASPTPSPIAATSTPPASETPFPSPTLSASPSPTLTATPTSTPPLLPSFASKLIRPGVEPQTYLGNPCEYLRLRWSPENSPPGTVVVPVMFHSIRGDGKPVSEGNFIDITSEQFSMFIEYARQMGFETITAAQLADFLQNNARIPSRSLLMIVDDRRAGTVEEFILPYLEENDWTVTLGWIIADTNNELWSRMERLNATGRLDIQSHGLNHVYITDQTPEEEVRQEIFDPIPILEEHFGQRPTTFVWPGGNFTTQSVQLAREAGYQLAFTAFSRGPLMFNWIPQGAEERAVGDPIMTLPRFWSPDLTLSLDIGMRIGKAAQAEALDKYSEEADYYRTYCAGELPPPSP